MAVLKIFRPRWAKNLNDPKISTNCDLVLLRTVREAGPYAYNYRRGQCLHRPAGGETLFKITTICPNMTKITAASITEAAVVLGRTIKDYIPKSAYSFDFNGYICMATTNRNIFIEGIPVSEVSLRKGNCFFFAARSRRRSNAASTFVTSGYFSGIGFV